MTCKTPSRADPDSDGASARRAVDEAEAVPIAAVAMEMMTVHGVDLVTARAHRAADKPIPVGEAARVGEAVQVGRAVDQVECSASIAMAKITLA